MSWQTTPADLASLYAAGSQQDPHCIDDDWRYDPTFVKTYRDDDETRAAWGLPPLEAPDEQRGEAA